MNGDLTGNISSDMGNADVSEADLSHDNPELCVHSTHASIHKEHGDIRSKDSDRNKVVYENLELCAVASISKQYGDTKEEEEHRDKVVLSGQETHFLAWSAGLIICALRFQLNLMSRLFATLLVAWYQCFLFALNPGSHILKTKSRALAIQNGTKKHLVMVPKVKDKVVSFQSTFRKGARRLVFGCSTAFYTIFMLMLLFVSSLMLSHVVVNGFVYEPIQLYEDLYFDYTQSLPVASVDFPFAQVSPVTGSMMRRIARPTQKYSVIVSLTLPESDFNKELGIFQVTMELLSTTGQVLSSKTQPCMLHFRSTVLQHAKSLLMAVPLLTGLWSETQTLTVSPLEWQDRSALYFAAVRVVLAPRAGRPSATGLPELYDAEVCVNSELPLWVEMIGNWRWTISVWIGLVLFVLEVLLLLCLYNQLLIPDVGILLSYGAGESDDGKASGGKVLRESALEDIPKRKQLPFCCHCPIDKGVSTVQR